MPYFSSLCAYHLIFPPLLIGRLGIAYLSSLWSWNRKAFSSLLVADFLLALALLLLAHSVYCLKKYYPRSVGTARNIMLTAFVVAAIIPTIQFLQNLGARTVALWVLDSQSFDSHLVALELACTITFCWGFFFLISMISPSSIDELGGAQVSWIYGVVYIAVAVGLIFQAYIGIKTGRSTRFHVVVSVLAAFMGLYVHVMYANRHVLTCFRVCFTLNITVSFQPEMLTYSGFCSLFCMRGIHFSWDSLTHMLGAMFFMPAWLVGVWSQLGTHCVVIFCFLT